MLNERNNIQAETLKEEIVFQQKRLEALLLEKKGLVAKIDQKISLIKEYIVSLEQKASIVNANHSIQKMPTPKLDWEVEIQNILKILGSGTYGDVHTYIGQHYSEDQAISYNTVKGCFLELEKKGKVFQKNIPQKRNRKYALASNFPIELERSDEVKNEEVEKVQV